MCARAWEDRLAAIAFKGRRCGSEAEVTLDVAVVHTRAARESAGGAAAIGAEIDLMIALAETYAAVGRAAPRWTDGAAVGTPTGLYT